MNKGVRYALFAVLWFSMLQAAEWQVSREPNQVSGKAFTGELKPWDTDAGQCRWIGAWGISLDKNDAGGLCIRKNSGDKAFLQVVFKFPYPVSELQMKTPALLGVDFTNGDACIEYALGDSQQYKPLHVWNKSHANYTVGGNIPSETTQSVQIPEAERNQLLTIRITLNGYAGTVDLGNAASLNYTLIPDRAGEVDWHFFPDAVKTGWVYTVNDAFHFDCAADAVDSVTVTDVGRNREADKAILTPMGSRIYGDLPQLSCGTYELNFIKAGKATIRQRFALVPPPRHLTWSEKTKSPFGIVGISRREGFREFKPVDGPAIARLLGIHQERTGWGSWLDYNAEFGKYNFPSREKIAESLTGDGIVYRNNLAWTPDWAVDHERIKRENYTGWTGHYPVCDQHLADFSAFAYEVAKNFKGIGVAEFEMWNEPNNEPFSSFKGTFEEYVKFCRTAAIAVHKANPQARMILGTTGDADVGFIARGLKAGLAEHFDIVDMHPYRHTDQGPEDGLLGDINRLKTAIQMYGKDQKIIFSEVGWPTTQVSTGSYGNVDEFHQACFNTRTLLISIAAGVERIHFHMMEDWGSDPNNPEHHFGFFRVDGTPKVAVSAMAGVTNHLEKARFLGRFDTESLVHAWYWKSGWEKNRVLATVWGDMQGKPKPKPVVLPGKALVAYDMFGAPVTDGRIKVTDKETQVTVGADPLFIYFDEADLPQLGKLPVELRPWLKKRAEAPVLATAQRPDFTQLRYRLESGNELKAMGFAGVESEEARTAAQTNGGSRFDVCYDEDAVRFSFNIEMNRPWSNDREGWWLWAGDCVRIYLGKGHTGFMTPEDYQLCFAPTTASGNPDLSIISYDNANGLNAGQSLPAEFIAERNEHNWMLSCRIAWKDLGIKPNKGDVWALDVNGTAGHWNNPAGDNWTNPGRWGEVMFK